MAVQTGEWWKRKPAAPIKTTKKLEWWEIPKYIRKPLGAQAKKKAPTAPKNYVQITPQQRAQLPNGGRVQGVSEDLSGGGGLTAEQAAYAARQAEDNAKRNQLRGKAGSYLDQLATMYQELIGMVENVGKDGTKRINKSYDDKVLEQNELMNEGMYTTDAANAANNLAHSSWMSFDRGKIRKAKDANVSTLNEGRANDLSAIGKMISEDTARYTADKANLGRTRELLGQTEDIGELTSTVNNLGNTVASTQAAKGKYGTQGEFVQRANSLGNYDTSTLEKTMQTIVNNTSASPQAKQAAFDDLLGGAPLTPEQKKQLKSKYIQVV